MGLHARFFLIILVGFFDLVAEYSSLDSLIRDFSALPKNRDGATNYNSGFAAKNRSQEAQVAEFKSVVAAWMKMRSEKMNQSNLWLSSNLGVDKPEANFFKSSNSFSKFMPFVERIEAPASHRFILRGDLHGDISSLVAQLKEMKKQGLIDNNFKLKPGVTMGFLGDYVDRGHYGLEVLYTLAHLCLANPDNVFCVRGNHEDLNLSSRYGFKDEVATKFGDKDGELHTWIGRMYDYMPVAVYLGDQGRRYVQLCHGGIEQGYQPGNFLESDKRYQLVGALHRARSVQDILQDNYASPRLKNAMEKVAFKMKDNVILRHPCDSDLPLGFMWNDFDPVGDRRYVVDMPHRGLQYGQSAVDAVLTLQSGQRAKIIGVIRAHQHAASRHDPMMQNIQTGGGCWNMRGCGCGDGIGRSRKHKDVITLNVAPDSSYGMTVGFDDDTALELIPSEQGSWVTKLHKYYP